MKELLRERVSRALADLGVSTDVVPGFEKPRQESHGDLTTNVAMAAARSAGRPPRELAGLIAERLRGSEHIDAVEVAGPGFLNFRISPSYYVGLLSGIVAGGPAYGRGDDGAGRRAQVEFVSANPTGPLTVGHGRGAVFGDSISRLLEWSGWKVTREYYFNNAGRQMRVLGDSVRLRYLEEIGQTVTFPEDYYQGEYIRDIARGLKAERGGGLSAEPAEGEFRARAETEIFADIRKTLSSLGIGFDVYYNEHTLYESGKVERVLADLRAKGVLYDAEGAVWLKLTALGGEKDKVVVKNTGEPTYRLPDIAYHREKCLAGYDLMIDVLGADHVATYPDVLAALRALGEDVSRIKVLIHQFVTIVQGGETVKMSTRKANFITLDELIADSGADVVRYFFLMRGIDSHLNFDLALARKQSEENPVYYLQYAHARIASIVRHAETVLGGQSAGGAGAGDTGGDTGGRRPGPGPVGADRTTLSHLKEPEEIALAKILSEFPETVKSCAATFEPHRLAEYLQEVAGRFHRFYHEHRVVTEDLPLTAARLVLCSAVKTVVGNGCAILGIKAPEKM
jgi:arginyl-tRNA synthetase